MQIDLDRLDAAYQTARDRLLAERAPAGHWVGELSTSALSTATAVMALEQVRRDRCSSRRREPAGPSNDELTRLIDNGIAWLIAHQNEDGGWGDTTKSKSNISTTMLCRASIVAAGDQGSGVWDQGSGSSSLIPQLSALNAAAYIDAAGGVPGLIARYGKDRTFSVPILTHCALAGLVDWRTIPALPFELACLPARFYAAVRLPVVSYALPALIAIGQVRHHFAPTRNPVTRVLRSRAIAPSLRVLERIQPSNGGFLEATPLTSFVTMSLAGMGRSDHPVAVKGIEFIVNSVHPDGSWPIDTNLATWVTTLAVNALGDDLPGEDAQRTYLWLFDQQYEEIHPYTNAAPGGWAWTDLPGGVPDADDTAGAMLAIPTLLNREKSAALPGVTLGRMAADAGLFGPWPRGLDQPTQSISAAARWLIDLQNPDGGFPTFCRGWGALPFDRSSPDITAHAIRALIEFRKHNRWVNLLTPMDRRSDLDDLIEASCIKVNYPKLVERLDSASTDALNKGFRFLRRAQRSDGSWLPLWFGNQYAPNDINPTYGTARVLAAFRDAGLADDPAAKRGVAWLLVNQNDDGGWGGMKDTPSSVEETALALEILCDLAPEDAGTWRGIEWLIRAVEDGSYVDPSPVGFYFAKLWYFERLYPVIFTVGALRAARRGLNETVIGGHDRAAQPA
ncbi:MAG: squalene--hopene cyclase [Planctomycetaceae bacterium]|nr:squalene--hopene cyclase [Planctomycetaceae bacterium]